jgi:hypothetical protein
MKRLLFLSFALALTFFAGVTVGHYQLPPYPALRSLKNTLFSPSYDSPSFDPRKHRSAYYLKRRTVFQVPEWRADVIMLGASIMEMGEWHQLFPNISILNRGIGGDTSDGVLDRLQEITRRQPKTVFLMIGLNDLMIGIPPRTVEENIKSIVSALSGSGIKPIVQSILFVADDPELNTKIKTLNDALSRWCSNSNITYVDLNSFLAPDGKLLQHHTSDGIHLIGSAYFLWRDAIAPHMPVDSAAVK